MAGYIGSKTVNLSTTGADIAGDADVSGALTVDTNTLYVDSTNNRVGIGTSSPSSPLTVSASAATVGQFISSNSSGYVEIDNSGGGGYIGTSGNNMLFLTSTSGSERMRIDDAGRVTTPFQPAFVATNAPSTFTNAVDIVWSSTALNRGSVYNTSNGRFTAPVAGLYQFFASVRIENTASAMTYYRISFRHNGSFVQSSRSQLSHRTATGYYSHSANDQAIYLNLNDYVNVMFETSASSSISTSAAGEHVFYGYLIG